jgi:hypothetical protein
VAGQCACGFCCSVGDNLRMHRIAKWMWPLVCRSQPGGE